MKFYKVRDEILQGRSISSLPLRVTFYARVSTETEEQLNSLDNQISYFKDYICSNKNWVYVNGYVDEGISGSSVRGRKKFLEMIEDAKLGYFDMIITKEVSRFSRNLSDSIKYTQELIKNDVGVFFQSNGINTYDPNSEFILNMMGSVAQEEVKRLSARIKWGHKEAIKKGHVLGSSSITGYRKNNTKLVVDEKEAEFVQKVFQLYATDKYGFYKLAMKLYKLGYKNSNNNVYSKDTLRRIIANPKYKGFYCGHTTEVIDYRTKQRILIPKNEQIIYKDETIPAIVSEELWDKANKVLLSRSNVVKTKEISNHRIARKYAYSGKMFCFEHNTTFQRSTGNGKCRNPRWACGCYMKYRLKSCESPIILESDLNSIFQIILRNVFSDKDLIMSKMIEYYSNVKCHCKIHKELNKTYNKISDIKNKKERILELNIEGNLSNLEFKNKNEQYNSEIEKLKQIAVQFGKEKKLIEISDIGVDNIKSAISDILDFKVNISKFIEEFVDEVIISKIDNNRNNIGLKVFLRPFKGSISLINGARHINDIGSNLLIFRGTYESPNLSRPNFKRNKFIFNVYFNK